VKAKRGAHAGWFSTAVYLLMGWLALVAMRPMFEQLPTIGMVWLLAGGICYTTGVVFFVMRPLLRRVLTPETTPLALPSSAELGPGMVPMNAEPGQQMMIDEPRQAPRPPSWMNNAKSMGEAQLETLKTVGTLVDDNPKQAALIVRDWLNSAA